MNDREWFGLYDALAFFLGVALIVIAIGLLTNPWFILTGGIGFIFAGLRGDSK